jgi:superfamily I DNA/RNA helicase
MLSFSIFMDIINKNRKFIFLKSVNRCVPKFTNQERIEIQSIVANLSIKRIPEDMIIKHIFNQTGKSISLKSLYNIRQRIKKESYDWYSKLREGEFEYLHEFKERINEIVDLQRMHHEIIIRNDNDKVYNPAIIQTSLAELHKLNITLSNYFDVAPAIGINSLSATPESKPTEQRNKNFIV